MKLFDGENVIVAEEEENKVEGVIASKPKRKRRTKAEMEAVKLEESVKEEEVAEHVSDDSQEVDKLIILIESWKKEYKKIYSNTFDEEFIIWRRLKRGEYKEITAEKSEFLDKQEMIVKKVVLYPENIDELIEDNGGLATVLAEEVLAKSGFSMSLASEM